MTDINKKQRKPRKPKVPKQELELDLSMDVQTAKDQKVIAESKEKIYSAKIKEIKYRQAEKAVIDTKVAVAIVTEVFSKLKQLLYSSTNQLTSRIVGKDHAQVSKIMFEFIDETLTKTYNDFENKIENINIEDIEEDEG